MTGVAAVTAVFGPAILAAAASGPADAGPTVFAMCLVDARTWDTLWFDARRGGFDFKARASVEAVVSELYGTLTVPPSR